MSTEIPSGIGMEWAKLQLLTCWEVALMDAISKLSTKRKNPNEIVQKWWDPYTMDSEILSEILNSKTQQVRRDPAFRMLRLYVDNIRVEFEDIEPRNVIVLEATDYAVSLLVDYGEETAIRILNPIEDIYAQYEDALED